LKNGARRRKGGDAVPLLATAQARHPNDFWLSFSLGDVLQEAKRWDEAVGYYRAALAVRPEAVAAHTNLGRALREKGHLGEAIREFRIAIALDPKDAMLHNNLGNALYAKGRREEAIGEYRKAIQLHPKYAQAHGALGQALLQLGRFAEAREATRRCLELLPGDHPLRQTVTQQLRQCEQALALDQKLTAVLEGKEKPADDAQRLALAQLCQQPFQKRYAASARFYTEAFANDPRLAGNLQAQYRYHAACAAALAGCGQGNDADKLDDKEPALLRKQALDWLRDDLKEYHRAVEQGKSQAAVVQRLTHWQKDADLAGVRDKDALNKLPEGERADWQKLWADVEALRKQTGKPE
jgi:tetratricopeptide (TPR) repeat protein